MSETRQFPTRKIIIHFYQQRFKRQPKDEDSMELDMTGGAKIRLSTHSTRWGVDSDSSGARSEQQP